MNFSPLSVHGARLIESEFHVDHRGSFARAWCRREFSEAGIDVEFVQANLARTDSAGTIRGLHYQEEPHAEAKLLRCTRGAVYDVIVDIRPDSPTFMEWAGVELSSEDATRVFVPAGCAHGYQTLRDESEVSYLVSAFYTPRAEGGIRWDDPAFEVDWPMAPTEMSEKDRSWPLFDPDAVGAEPSDG